MATFKQGTVDESGFGQLKTRDAQTGVQTTTRYRHDFPFTGMPVSTTARTASGRLLSESTTTWRLTGHQSTWEATAKASGTAALGALKPHAAEAVERAYDLNDGNDDDPALLTTVTTTTARDAHGNATTATAGPSATPPSARPRPSPRAAARRRSPTARTARGSSGSTPTATAT